MKNCLNSLQGIRCVNEKTTWLRFPHYGTRQLRMMAPYCEEAYRRIDKSGVCFSALLPVINHTAVLAHRRVVSPGWIILTYLAVVSASEASSAGRGILTE